MRVVVHPALGDALPITLDDVVAAQVPVVRQVTVHIVPVQHPIPGFQAAGAGNPDRRVRLLHRARPNADVAQLVVLAVENGRLALRPGLHHHIVGFGVPVAQGDGNLSVGKGGVHRRADGEPGHQAAAGDDIQHRHFLGHAHRRVVQRQAVAQDNKRAVAGSVGQHRGNQVGRRHYAVGIVVVFVDADAVKAGPVGVLQLGNIVGVIPVALGRVKVFVGQVNPGGMVLRGKVVGQILVGHQMEKGYFHGNQPRRRAGRPCVLDDGIVPQQD